MKEMVWKANRPIVISLLTMIILSVVLATNAISRPTVVWTSPGNWWWSVPVNTNITIQFSESMDRASVEDFFELEDDHDNEIGGAFIWNQTVSPDDTVTFIPHDTLRYGTHYSVWFTGCSTAGECLDGTWPDYHIAFITRSSYADATPPTVQFIYPYDGMTDVPTAGWIFFTFNEAMDPLTINGSTIILSDESGPVDYGVGYDFGPGWMSIGRNAPLDPLRTYTVTITTDVKDEHGNWLESPYTWSFTTGASDTTEPTVDQTIPANGETNVSINPWIWAYFSEEMAMDSFSAPGNITLFDNDLPGYVDISFRDMEQNMVAISPQADLEYGHTYTVTITTGVHDSAGNSLDPAHSWSFTTVSEGENGDPVILCGLEYGEQAGIRDSSGTGVELDVCARDSDLGDETLNVSANGWILSLESPLYAGYIYESSGNEGLSTGTHTLTFVVRDNNTPSPNEVSFEQDIYIFNSYPLLTSPSNGVPISPPGYGKGIRPLTGVHPIP
jgi:hypothetical protein